MDAAGQCFCFIATVVAFAGPMSDEIYAQASVGAFAIEGTLPNGPNGA